MVEQLLQQGYSVIVIDNLQEGHREAVLRGAVFYEGDFGDWAVLESIFQKYAVDVVFHFAAETTIEFSMSDPGKYFVNNVVNGVTLLEVMRKYQCDKFIFSSTAATFGDPQYIPIDEKHSQIPINAYGESKLMFEKVLDWYHRAYGLKFNAFRYFNAAGASARLGEHHKHESHLIPMVLRRALGEQGIGGAERRVRNGAGERGRWGAREPRSMGVCRLPKRDLHLATIRSMVNATDPTVITPLKVFGNDYPTRDGTCVRDYIHVIDLAQAHILALNNLDRHPNGKYNLGKGVHGVRSY